MSIEVSPQLRSGYDEQYSDEMTEWRTLGGKSKALNIVELTKHLPIERVLDCGAGEGAVLEHLDRLSNFREFCAVDISDSGIQQIEKRNLPKLRDVQKFDGYRLPYPDDNFDLAYATHVIEHVEHPRLLLRELKRVSKYQVLEVPLDYRLGIDNEVRGQLSIGHINIYTPSLFRFLVRSEGFAIIDERLTRLSREVIRYNWYKNEKRAFSLKAEVELLLAPLRERWTKLQRGKRAYEEYEYDALTVLTEDTGELTIMQ